MAETAAGGGIEPTSSSGSSDYDYIVRIVQYLDERHAVRFFISTRDFDVLYRWWEKRIPLEIIERSIAAVAERFRKRAKPLRQMESFSYEVRKNYRDFLTLETSRARRLDELDPLTLFRRFMEDFPEAIEPLKPDFEEWLQRQEHGDAFDPEPLFEKLLILFRDDGELNAKAEFFLRNLAPELRKPEMKRKYRLNYLLNRFRVPFVR